MTLIDKDFEFHEIVSKVEERFRKVYDGEKVAKAVSEGQMEPDMVSTGWWVVLSRFGIAIRFGNMKPDIAAGDTLVLVAHVLKKPDAPVLAIVPPAPIAPTFTTAEIEYMKSVLDYESMHERGPEDPVLSDSIRSKLELTTR